MASLPILVKYLIIFLVSMIPIVELRGAIPIAEGLGLNILLYYPIAIIGNMLPVPFIFRASSRARNFLVVLFFIKII